MIQIQLSNKERERLETLRRTVRSRVAERCHYILLNAEGQSVPQIAKTLNRNAHTVRGWLKAYQSLGIDGLYDTPQPGRPASKTEAVLEHLDSLLSQNPDSWGYQESGWNSDLLLHALEQKGVIVSEKTLRNTLKKDGWVYKRFKKTVPSRAPSSAKKKSGWSK